jgi:ABC-type multidrug transport system ATPase subunit
MLGDPPILLLDEPVASLDPISVVEIREAIRAYGQSACVLVSTHQLAEARALCDRVLILDHGRLVFDGPLLAMGGDCDRDVEIRVGGVEVVVAEAIVNELRPVVSPTFVARPGEDLVVRVRGANRADIATLVRRFVSVGGDVSGVESIGDALENAFASAVSGSAQVSP